MSVHTLPTTAVYRWDTAQGRLVDSVTASADPRLSLHLATADAIAATGLSPRWADRIAAIQVLAARRADRTATAAARVIYLDAADAAESLLFEAERIHGIVPSEAARLAIAELAEPAVAQL